MVEDVRVGMVGIVEDDVRTWREELKERVPVS